MNVARLMKNNVETCYLNDSLATAAAKMWECDIGILPVLNPERHVIGVITDRDICMATYIQGKAPVEIPVATAMSKAVFFTTPEATIREAQETMRAHKVRRLPVINTEGQLVGILSLDDIAREAEREVGHTPREVSSYEVMVTLAEVCEPRLVALPLL